ncbi:MAG: EsaB/YukD family protein [Hespellia sp.]|nr:EsaB/YukD family protein [Hespellia sp.]
MKENVVVTVHVCGREISEELEIPLDISANELIIALGQMYGLAVDRNKLFGYYLKVDEPKALLRGEKLLGEYGIRNGSQIWTWNY